MKYLIFAALCIVFSVTDCLSQEVVSLYDGRAPGSEGWTRQEVEFTHPMLAGLMVRNVVDPTLTVFRPENPNGTAVIVCPGGGFHWLSFQSEGTAVAEWLSAKGVTAFVLKYRLVDTGATEQDLQRAFERLMGMILSAGREDETGGGRLEDMRFTDEMNEVSAMATADGIAAMEYVRQHASEYSIDPNSIGMIGFSAGAMVGMNAVLHGEPASMPDFLGHIYGGGIGDREIPSDAPPLFILCAADDRIAGSSPDLFKQWTAAGYSAELHIYSTGGHGFGMQQKGLPIDSWIERFWEWMSSGI